jgi:chromate transporter
MSGGVLVCARSHQPLLFFDGMNAAMVGVVGAVTVDLGRSALRTRRDLALAALCCVLLAARIVSEPALAGVAVAIGIFSGAKGGGKVTPAIRSGTAEDAPPASKNLHFVMPPLMLSMVATGSFPSALAGLMRVFLPIGVMTFGGGLAMIPALDHMVVVEQRWLDPKAFADAIALGQITPGPVAICATFIGYRVAGIAGALVATFAMFAPATAVALAAGHYVEQFRASPIVKGILNALGPAVIGMLGAATLSLGRSTLGVPMDLAVAVTAFLILIIRPVSPLWFLVGGGFARLIALRLTGL